MLFWENNLKDEGMQKVWQLLKDTVGKANYPHEKKDKNYYAHVRSLSMNWKTTENSIMETRELTMEQHKKKWG